VIRLLRAAALAAAAMALSACVSVPMAPPVASIDTLQAVQASGLPAMKVGEFKRGPNLSAQADKTAIARGSTVKPPSGTSFAAYLGETLSAELAGAGKLDAASEIEISGFLVESRLDAAGFSVGSGSIGARFIVKRKGEVVYDRLLRTDAQWESNFIGAIAIPAAINGYNSLYPKLVQTLLKDPEFVRAVKGG
jgi:hypothetical protein